MQHNQRTIVVGILLYLVLGLVSSALYAIPVENGVAICTVGYDQRNPKIVSDGLGGAIITWQDSRNGSDSDIYAQRVNSSGLPLWTLNGVALCTAAGGQSYPTIISDGLGGAFITWQDARDGGIGGTTDIYAQRVNSTGSTLWTVNGVAICTAGYRQEYPTLLSDGAGGAIITWRDGRSGSNVDIYAQRVNSTGFPLWTLNGVAICTVWGGQADPTLVSDGLGGAIIIWTDNRKGGDLDIYAQRVNSDGSTLWNLDGVAISTVENNQWFPTLVSDGSGGAIITWSDYRSTTANPSQGADIYAQRVNSDGSTLWTLNGLAISTAGNDQVSPIIVSDGSGGVIITWVDLDIYAQRVDSTGSPLWTLNGVAICTVENWQFYPTLVSDDTGGAIITWFDARSGGSSDIYAQRVDSTGSPLWTLNGVAICTAEKSQDFPTLVSDGSGGAIITWQDWRDYGTNYTDIYAQKIDSEGNLVIPLSVQNKLWQIFP